MYTNITKETNESEVAFTYKQLNQSLRHIVTKISKRMY